MRIPEVQPNVIDKVVGYLSPERGMARLRARAGLTWLSGRDGGGYESGRSSSKSMQRYNPRARSASADVHPGLDKMRARSRDQVHNNPLAAGAVSTTVTSTVGSGLSCRPSIDADVLGLSEQQADAWEAQAQRIWDAWAETPECDIEHELVFGQIQNLVFRAVLESGDILRLRRFLWDARASVPRRGHTFATKVQVIEADRISNPHYLVDTAVLQGGVQVDRDGRTVGYHVQTTHPGEMYLLGARNMQWDFLPAYHAETRQRLAHLVFDKRRPQQRRGVPYLAPVIGALKQLERYTDAELMAAVVGAMFTVFVKHEGGADASPITGLEGATDTPESASDVYLGEGAIVDLAPDEDIEIANPGRPNALFDPFVMSVMRQVGVALELPFELLVKHFTASYSASRGAILEAWKFFQTRRRFLVTELCQPVYEDVISEAVARGMIDAPGFFDDPLIRRAWLGTVWTGDAMPQIDPLKEVKAATIRIQQDISTRDREAREMTGSSFLANHRQRRKEEQMRRDAGLSSAPDTGEASIEDEKTEEGAESLLIAGGVT